MRISDWSSDVCSSDLPDPGRLALLHRVVGTVRLLGMAQAFRLGVNSDTPHHRLGVRLGHRQSFRSRWPEISGTGRFRSGWRGRMRQARTRARSEEHTSELQSLMRISYAVFCLKKNTNLLSSL